MLIANALIFAVVAVAHTFFTQVSVPGLTPARMAGAAAAIVFLLCAVSAWKTNHLRATAAVFLITMFAAILFTALMNGGLPAPTSIFLIVAPLTVGVLSNWRWGLISLVAVLISVLGLHWAASSGVASASPHSAGEQNLLKLSATLLSAVAVFISMFGYEVVMRRAVGRADRLNEKLQKATQELNQQIALKTDAQAALQKRNEELERSKSFLSTVLNSVQDGIVACDHDGQLTLFNDAAREFHGVDVRELPPEAWAAAYDLFSEDGETLLRPDDIPLRKAFAGETVDRQEIVIAPRNLPERRVICRAAPLFDSHGAKIGAVATMHDVSVERAQAEEMRRQRNELELIFDNVPVRIWLKDDKNTILRLNKPAAAAMGVPLKQAAGASAYDLFPTMAKKYHDDDLAVIRSGEPNLGIIERFETANGSHSWISTDKVPYTDEKTGEQFVFVAASDITPMMEKAEKLRQLNGELENFARVASHDLQEPLRKLLIFSDFLEQDLGDDLPERAKKDLEAITSASKRMHGLVKDILELARMTGDIAPMEPVDPVKIIRSVMQDFAPRCKAIHAVLVYDDLPEVMAEPRLLRQVYHNLIGNALKFVRTDQIPRIHFTANEIDNQIVLGVKDNGIGVGADHFDKIFQPLQRLHGRNKYDGAGIGLAICKKAMDSMSGRIWVESNLDAGAHFRFSLAKAEETAVARAPSGVS